MNLVHRPSTLCIYTRCNTLENSIEFFLTLTLGFDFCLHDFDLTSMSVLYPPSQINYFIVWSDKLMGHGPWCFLHTSIAHIQHWAKIQWHEKWSHCWELTWWNSVIVLVNVFVNVVNEKIGWPIIKLKLMDNLTRHELVEVRCTEEASCIHDGSE